MFKLRIFWCLCLAMLTSACSSSRSKAWNNGASCVHRVTEIRAADDGISSIAAREVIRRRQRVRRADAAALRANRYSSQGDHEAAVRSYREALDTLPSSE